MTTNKEKLLDSLRIIFNESQYKNEIGQLLNTLHLSKEKVIEEFLHYNLDVYPEGNNIYQSMENRLVLHIHNLIKNSWHTERQKTVIEFLKKANPKTISDTGFGVPSLYVKEFVLKNNIAHLTFLDLYDPAFTFAETLLNIWDVNWQKKINFQKMDMNDKKFIGDYDIYILQDAVEHTLDPEGFLKIQVSSSRPESFFLISIPIGPIIPIHYHAWHTEKEAADWLKSCGLKILEYKAVYVNPEVDVFAEPLGFDYCDLYALCCK
jgi:hypothetical protein